jgi:hypothetical protein
MTPATRRVVGAVTMLVAALAVQRASTAPWGRVRAPDGSILLVSPIGVTRAATADAPEQRCRWWPEGGERALCAAPAGAGRARARLRLAYPLLQLALWGAVGSLFLQVLRRPASPGGQLLLPAIVTGLAAGGAALTVGTTHDAVESLRDLPIHWSGPGAFLAALTILAGVSSAAALLRAAPQPPPPPPAP